MNNEIMDKWIEAQSKLLKEHHENLRVIKSKKGYARGERKEAIDNERKRYFREFYKTKMDILGR